MPAVDVGSSLNYSTMISSSLHAKTRGVIPSWHRIPFRPPSRQKLHAGTFVCHPNKMIEPKVRGPYFLAQHSHSRRISRAILQPEDYCQARHGRHSERKAPPQMFVA